MLKNRCLLALVLIAVLGLAGCTTPSTPKIPDIQSVKVTAVVKSEPISIGNGGAGGDTGVTLDDFQRVTGKKLNSSGQIVDGPGESILRYDKQGIQTPDVKSVGSDSNSPVSRDVVVNDNVVWNAESISFDVDLDGRQEAVVAVTLEIPGEAPQTLSRTIVNNHNEIVFTDAEKAFKELIESLLDADKSFNLTVVVSEGTVPFDSITLSNVELKARIEAHINNNGSN